MELLEQWVLGASSLQRVGDDPLSACNVGLGVCLAVGAAAENLANNFIPNLNQPRKPMAVDGKAAENMNSEGDGPTIPPCSLKS